jgi:phosphoribosylformylglycinamidine synthase
MDLKNRTARVCLITPRDQKLETLAATHRALAGQIAAGRIAAAHDVSDGGVAVAAAEMCIASGLGLIVGNDTMTFDETPGQYLIELADIEQHHLVREGFDGVADVIDFGLVQHFGKLTITTQKERVIEIGIDEMTRAWRGTLDW